MLLHRLFTWFRRTTCPGARCVLGFLCFSPLARFGETRPYVRHGARWSAGRLSVLLIWLPKPPVRSGIFRPQLFLSFAASRSFGNKSVTPFGPQFNGLGLLTTRLILVADVTFLLWAPYHFKIAPRREPIWYRGGPEINQ